MSEEVVYYTIEDYPLLIAVHLLVEVVTGFTRFALG